MTTPATLSPQDLTMLINLVEQRIGSLEADKATNSALWPLGMSFTDLAHWQNKLEELKRKLEAMRKEKS